MQRILILVLSLLFLATSVVADVEWQLNRNIQLPSSPVDITTSADGQKIFVLLAKGEVQIYDTNGQRQETLKFDAAADKIVVSPDGEKLLLSDSKGKQVQLVTLSYVKPIDIAGSPFKGPKDAKVVVAVYSDFQ